MRWKCRCGRENPQHVNYCRECARPSPRVANVSDELTTLRAELAELKSLDEAAGRELGAQVARVRELEGEVERLRGERDAMKGALRVIVSLAGHPHIMLGGRVDEYRIRHVHAIAPDPITHARALLTPTEPPTCTEKEGDR